MAPRGQTIAKTRDLVRIAYGHSEVRFQKCWTNPPTGGRFQTNDPGCGKNATTPDPKLPYGLTRTILLGD